MRLLDAVLPGRSGEPPEEQPNVQYEIQRMTHNGGWKAYESPIDGPRDEPLSDHVDWINDEGRYRLLRREDGRIDDVLWTYETIDAQELYERNREEEAQREQLQAMSFEEVEQEYFGETNRLDRLDMFEIGERYDELADNHDETATENQELNEVEQSTTELELLLDELKKRL